MALGLGSIAFVGFNADGAENLAFVVFENIAAGTEITFTDNEWNGSAFNSGENTWTWTAMGDVAAGTVVTMDDLATTSPTSNAGMIEYLTTGTRDFAPSSESVYAFVGEASSPTFLAAIANSGFVTSVQGRLDNTGLVAGETAIDLATVDRGADTAAYSGPRGNVANFSDFLASINDPANWIAQDTSADDSNDGTAPDVPFSTTPFEADPSLQQINFAPDSVSVSQVEGDGGATTIYTFTVQRTNGTTGEVAFSGTLTPGTNVDAADFGGTLPLTFSGTIADGETTGTMSIAVSGDITLEEDESFQLTLTDASNEAAGVALTGQTEATGTIVNNDTLFQTISFSPDSYEVTSEEGDAGAATTYTFAVVRTSDDMSGELTFTARISGRSSSRADADDFGGTFPTVVGVIPDGETSGTISITVTGDDLLEGQEGFRVDLIGGITDAGIAVIPDSSDRTYAYGTILNDDFTVHDGDLVTQVTLTGDDHLLVENGGSLSAASFPITVTGENVGIVVDNHGSIATGRDESGAIRMLGDVSGSLTINNHADGVIKGDLFLTGASDLDQVVVNNDGLMDGSGAGIGAVGATVNNSSTGVITSFVRDGATLTASVVNNYGEIMGGSQDAAIAETVHNYAGGLIQGPRHAVTGSNGVTVINDAGGTMIGDGGSAVNIDNNADVENTVHVTNYGAMEGGQTGVPGTVDGDAIDVDGLLALENYGRIAGLGAQGRHDGEPNVSEAVAIGGGTITNHAGGEIYGYGRAIQVDNSSNSDAFAAATIYNEGLIQGDGHLPTAVSPEEVAEFAERIRSGEAINIEGSWADTLTNAATGQIIGGVKMGGGDDVVSNSGAMAATGGSAVDLGEGDDTFEAHAGSTVDGLIDGGGGEDTLKLVGPGVGSLGENANFETLDIQSGIWSLESDAYDAVNVATGAMATSQLRLAEQGALTMAAGATLLVTSGDDAVVAEGAAGIENAGLIQALGMKGAAPAKAIVTNGGAVHNAAGGIILAQGAAIGSGDAATAGVDIVNEGMIQSLSGEAIALSGEQDDSVTNQGVISGNVDLGAGDDALDVHTTSSIAGAIEGGEGDDTVNLLGAGNGSLGAASGFENLNVQSGTWSVADGAVNFSDITIEDGAAVNSQIVLSNADMLTIEGGGALDTTASREFSLVMTGGSVLDNAGTIRAEQLTIAVGEGTSTELGGGVTITNRAGGVIESADNRAIQINANLNGETFAISNAGRIESGDHYAIDFRYGVNGNLVLDNLAGGVIQTYADEDVIRGGDNLTINNTGTIANTADEPGESGGDAVDLKGETGGVVNNLAGGVIEGSRHAVTGEESVTIVNDGTMIGRNGSAVNIDNSGDAEDKVFITNRGVMEGRSAETSDSDGDAVDVDGLVQVLNYGRISGLGAEGYHDGEPNVSEAIAIGGGTILNYGSDAVIHGYGRAIQVDNSSNENALGKTLINNDGLIQGDGHGPEGVDPQDAAQFDLRGNEAINLVGDYDDEILNQSTGRIVGGVSMGGGNDRMNNSGSITATGGSAINMGAGNDHLNLYVGATVLGTILLGAGDDLVTATSGGDFEIDGGEGDDEIYMASAVIGGDDIVDGGAGNDRIYGGLGEDRIAGDAGDDELVGEAGDDLIEGGDGGDTIDGGDGDDVLFGDDGDDTITASAGDDMVKGNDGDDVFLVAGLDDGRDQYDGGDGVDTLDFSMVSESVNLVLKDGVARSAGDKVENIENVTGGEAADRFTGNSLDNMLLGNAGDDTLNGRVGDDGLDGGAGNDKLIGAAGNDKLDGGEGDDDLNGGRGDDYLVGGLGDDMLKGAAGDDVLVGGGGGDTLTGGGGHDRFVFNSLGDGIDTITDFRLNGRSADQFVFSASMFEGFTGDDAFDLIGSGFLQAVDGSCGSTFIQVDADGGGDAFQTLACVNGNISNGMLADRAIVDLDPVA